jgi:polysaccharide biosynthesis transport protein
MENVSADPASIGEAEHANPSASRNYFRIVVERKWYLVLGVILSSAVGAIFYSRQTPVYQASMQVLLIKKGDILPAPGVDSRSSVLDDYVGTQLALIKSPLVLEKVAKQKEIKDYPWAATTGQAVSYLMGGLSVKNNSTSGASSSSSILVFSFTSLDSTEGEPVLRAVFQGYREFLDDTYKDVSKTTIDLITNAKDVLETQLQGLDKEYQEFREKTPLSRLKLNKEGTTLSGERFLALQGKLSGFLIRKVEIEGHLKAIEKARKNKASPAMLLEMANRFDHTSSTAPGERTVGSPDLSGDQLLLLKAQEEELLREKGPDHPDVQEVRQKMRVISSYLAAKGSVVALNQDRSKPGAVIDPIELHERSLRQEIDEIDQTADSYTQTLGSEVSQAKDVMSAQAQEESLVNRRDRKRELYNLVTKRLSEIDLVKDSGGFRTELITPPPPVGARTATPLRTVFGVSTLCGLLAGFGLACLAEISDHSFRSPAEIVSRLGVRVVGHIPSTDIISRKKAGIDSGVSPMLWVHHRSKSRYAEAFREIRTYLFFTNRESKPLAIQITSSRAGDGKTTVASNLATSLAQSGKRVLLVDADCRRPRVHKIFGLGNEKGLTSVLSEGTPIADALSVTEVPGLSIMLSGPSVQNPSELLTSPAFQNLIAKLKEEHDYVIVDTPPILAVSDPSIVAASMDGIFLVVRLGKNERVDAERATQVLQGLGGNILGVIVNGVGSKKQGYGYRYGYGGRSYYYGAYYGGSYGSYYDKQRDGSYYTEDSDREVSIAKSAFDADNKGNEQDEQQEESGSQEQSVGLVRAPVSTFFRWLRGE